MKWYQHIVPLGHCLLLLPLPQPPHPLVHYSTPRMMMIHPLYPSLSLPQRMRPITPSLSHRPLLFSGTNLLPSSLFLSPFPPASPVSSESVVEKEMFSDLEVSVTTLHSPLALDSLPTSLSLSDSSPASSPLQPSLPLPSTSSYSDGALSLSFPLVPYLSRRKRVLMSTHHR